MSTQLLRQYIDILNESSTASAHPISPAQVWSMMELNEVYSDDSSAWQQPSSGGMLRDVVDRIVNNIDNNISSRSKNVDISIQSGEAADTLTIVLNAGYIIPLFADNVEPDNIHKAMLIVLNLYRTQGWDAQFKKNSLVLSAIRKH